MRPVSSTPSQAKRGKRSARFESLTVKQRFWAKSMITRMVDIEAQKGSMLKQRILNTNSPTNLKVPPADLIPFQKVLPQAAKQPGHLAAVLYYVYKPTQRIRESPFMHRSVRNLLSRMAARVQRRKK